jgi:acyl dehydratase
MPELSSPPSLLPLYAKAAATSALHRGDSLPSTVYTLADQPIDRAHLAAYQRVCGFAVSDAVPPTYLHVLAFPLAMRLMTDGAFPFGVMGLVHVANRIDQRRPVRAGDSVELRVRAADLRPHDRGRQFDVVAEAWRDDELVWEDRSTYLRRESGGAAGDREPPGAPAGGARWHVGADVGRRYAAVSGDRNPIHLHPLTARLFGQPSPIAHGMWLKARCLAALEGRLPEACGVEVRFKLPVRLGERVAFTSSEGGGGRWTFELSAARDGRPHLAGTVAPL